MTSLRRVREEVNALAANRGASNLRVFGSVVRGDDAPPGDLDLLVDLEPGRSLLDLGGLQMDLTEFLGVAVDVVTEPALSPRVRDRVLADAVAL